MNSPGYVLKTCEFVLPGNTPAGSDKFHVNAWTSGNGWVTIDDWSLTRVPPSGLPNAIGVKNVVAFGSQADIAWADPPLNGGQWVYHRTGIRNTISDYFGEVGWQKKSDGTFVGLVAWLNPSTGMVDHQEFSYVPGQTYNFATQYYPQTGEYLFFYNYTVVAQKYIGFSSSMNVFSGGEVADALESMGNVLHSNNHNVFQGGGGFYALPYGSHYKQVSSPYPYDIIDINANTWRSTGYD